MKRLCVVVLVASVPLVASPLVAAAFEARAPMLVTAQVAPRASLETLSQPAMLVITDDDLARGYVDVSAVYLVHNNDPQGYSLRLEPLVGLATMVEVSGLSTLVVMRGETVEVTQPAALEAKNLVLRFRLQLDPHAPAGAYPLPVRVSVATL